MKKKTGFWMIIGFLIFAFLIYFSWQMFGPTEASDEILSKQAAQKLVQDRYQGTVIQIKLTDEQYHIDLEKKDTIYQIELNAISGKVLSFIKKETKSPPLNQPEVTIKSEDEIRKIILAKVKGTITSFEKITSEDETIYKAVVKEGNNQTTLTVDAHTGEILLSTTTQNNTSSTKRLTEEEARDIAKKQVNGIVEHIWLETKGEQTYYLVEVETQDDREAIVQIHSITGNVMSVSWDDRSSDDDDDKNDDSKQRGKDDKKEDDD
ncbi:PepSY domain-containing protein [Neobacillus drentensis]|uniref:PepSY domain-containing protein n=1 Tax=Neobacillus drentensis TaxID=220684 RepID=UPI002FFED101